MLFRIGNLAQKELLQLTRDVMILIMILVGPVLQLALIARATTQGFHHQPIVVVDQLHVFDPVTQRYEILKCELESLRARLLARRKPWIAASTRRVVESEAPLWPFSLHSPKAANA